MLFLLLSLWLSNTIADDRIRAAFLVDFPPLYSLNEDGTPKGFALDILRNVATAAGLEVEYLVVDNWAQAQEAVRQGRADLIPGIGISAARQIEFAFSEEIETVPVSCFVRDSNHSISGVQDLAGHRVAVIDQSAAQTRLSAQPEISLVTFPNIDSALFQLLAGDVDAFVFPEPVLWRKARSIGLESKIKVVGKPVMELKRGFMLRKSSQDLLDRLNPAIARYTQSAGYADDYVKWYGAPAVFWTVQRIAWVMTLALLASVFSVLVWRNYSVSTVNRQLTRTIDELHQAQRALRASESRFRLLFEEVPNIALRGFDRTGKVFAWNQASTTLYQYDRDEAIDHRLEELIVSESLWDEWRRKMSGWMESGTPMIAAEVNLRRRDGTTIPVFASHVMLEGGLDEPVFYSIDVDLTELKAAEKALLLRQFALDRISEAVYLVGADGRFLYVNQGATRQLGFSIEELLCMDVSAVDCNTDAEEWEQHWEELKRQHSITFESRHRRKDGSDFPVEINANYFEHEGRSFNIGLVRDISQRKELECRAEYTSALEVALVEISNAFMSASHEDVDNLIGRALSEIGRLCRADRCFVFQFEEGRRLANNTHEWCADGIEPQIIRMPTISTARHPVWTDTLHAHKSILIADSTKLPDGWEPVRETMQARSARALLAVPIISNGRLAGFTGLDAVGAPRQWEKEDVRVLDVLGDLIGGTLERIRADRELRVSQLQLQSMAYFDPLTNLPNRRLFVDRMRQSMASVGRHEGLLAVAYLDLDGFKPVNDSVGHAIGDQLLVSISERLTAALRSTDTIARWGGDEFALLLTDLENVNQCGGTLQRLLESLAEPYEVAGRTIAITASIGATLYPQDDSDSDTLLRNADHAMYLAKESGRNRYCLFDADENRQVQSRHLFLERVEQAIGANEFLLHYQPKVDMSTGRVYGVEALIRWEHPEQGLLFPDAFLPQLNDHELLVDVDWYVLHQALGQLELWRTQNLDMEISINISARSLQNIDFVERLRELLRRHPGVEPSAIELEILETAALDDLTAVSQVIERCAEMQVSFALDDFGTGYSSLTYFRRLPAHILKIDRSFVHDMLEDTDDLNIVKGIIGLAEAFQREVIAEGVETDAHGALLLELGCRRAQGYGIARPMSPDAIPAWIDQFTPPNSWASFAGRETLSDTVPESCGEPSAQVWMNQK